MGLEQGLDEERRIYNTLLETEDRQEGLRAFAEKRKPRFRGT
jgi:methylglutaconyl-CoA hydratase